MCSSRPYGFTSSVGLAMFCERTLACGLKRTGATFESGPSHHRGHEVFDARRTDLLHGPVKLDAHQFEHALDSGLAERAEAPDVGPSDAHRARAHRQRLDDVGAAAKP